MKLKLLTAPFKADERRFDDGSVQTFLSDKDVIEVHHEFFTHDGHPYWSLLVTYRELREDASRPPTSQQWRDGLDPDAQARFDRLRS